MPLWLRKFTYKKLQEYYEDKEAGNTNKTIHQGIKEALIERQAKESTYMTKASRK